MPKGMKMFDESDPFKRNWGWLLGLGILLVILGCIGLSMTVGLTMASMVLLGVLLLIGGCSQIIDVFKSRRWKAVAWHALIGLLYLVGGIIIIYDPVLASEVITVLIAWVLIIIGISRLIMASILRDEAGWGWLVLAGVAAIVLGILILVQWPYSGLWVIGLFISIEMLINGWSSILIALAIKRG